MPAIFFFFQAEDGIRYLTVTGVQTCALPISPPGESAGPAAEGQAIYARLACGGCHTIQGVSGEIGRASCREKVEISVGPASLKKKKRTECQQSRFEVHVAFRQSLAACQVAFW